MIRVPIVEAHRPTRESLVKILRHSSEIEVVAAYCDAAEAESELPLLASVGVRRNRASKLCRNASGCWSRRNANLKLICVGYFESSERRT